MKVQQYDFVINALLVHRNTFQAEYKQIPYTTVACTYEGARTQALEQAQQYARNYDAEGVYKFFFYVGVAD